ncbi:MAG: response regulator [Flavobacteriales bacterium]|nr:response regulator [Flavobacteriales bacterium]
MLTGKGIFIKDLVKSFGLFALLLLAFVYAWTQFNKEVDHERENQVKLMGSFMEEKVESVVKSNIVELRNLRNRIMFSEGDYIVYLPEDAAQILDARNAFKFINWHGPSTESERLIPSKEFSSIANTEEFKDNHESHRQQVYKLGEEVRISPWMELANDQSVFVVDFPVQMDTNLEGSIGAGIDFRQELSDLINEAEGYHMHLFDQSESLFFCSDPATCKPISVGPELVFANTLGLWHGNDAEWKMQLYPVEGFFSSSAKFNNLMGLIMALLLSAALSIAMFLSIRYNRARLNLVSVNNVLEIEKKRAERISRFKSEFMSNVSHEIRTPLNAINGILGQLNDTQLDHQQQESVQLLENSSKNLLGLVNNILEAEQLDSGQITLNRDPFNLKTTVESVCKVFKPSFESKGLISDLVIKADVDSSVVGDEVRFVQIVSNLLRNAYKFTSEGKVILEFEASNLPNGRINCVVKVIDTGIGIPKEKQGKIFERFAQLDSGYTKKYEGTGFGLALSSEMPALMGGSITVDSEISKGTTFTITIPFDCQRTSEEALYHDQTANLTFKGADILIVEDNDLNIMVLDKMLNDLEVNVAKAINGREAVELTRSKHFDLILMDLHMPEMDGIQATKIIRNEGGPPIIMVSANVTREAVEDSTAAGVVEYITKPVTKVRLRQSIHRHLSLAIPRGNVLSAQVLPTEEGSIKTS